jgi:hypothetical protein
VEFHVSLRTRDMGHSFFVSGSGDLGHPPVGPWSGTGMRAAKLAVDGGHTAIYN